MREKMRELVANYLLENDFDYQETEDSDRVMFHIVIGRDELPEMVPDGYLECTIELWRTTAEFRCFYGENVMEGIRDLGGSQRNGLLELINFVNHTIFPGFEEEDDRILCSPCLVLRPEGDISYESMIDYEILDSYAEPCFAFMFGTMCGILSELSMPLFSVVAGRMSVEEAKNYISGKADGC